MPRKREPVARPAVAACRLRGVNGSSPGPARATATSAHRPPSRPESSPAAAGPSVEHGLGDGRARCGGSPRCWCWPMPAAAQAAGITLVPAARTAAPIPCSAPCGVPERGVVQLGTPLSGKLGCDPAPWRRAARAARRLPQPLGRPPEASAASVQTDQAMKVARASDGTPSAGRDGGQPTAWWLPTQRPVTSDGGRDTRAAVRPACAGGTARHRCGARQSPPSQ